MIVGFVDSVTNEILPSPMTLGRKLALVRKRRGAIWKVFMITVVFVWCVCVFARASAHAHACAHVSVRDPGILGAFPFFRRHSSRFWPEFRYPKCPDWCFCCAPPPLPLPPGFDSLGWRFLNLRQAFVNSLANVTFSNVWCSTRFNGDFYFNTLRIIKSLHFQWNMHVFWVSKVYVNGNHFAEMTLILKEFQSFLL